MKKFISGLIIGVLLSITVVYAAASLTAVPVTFPVYINGVLYNSTNPAVNVNNTTYMPVKALGDALGVRVFWNNEKKLLEIGELKKPTSQSSYLNPAGINTTLTINRTGSSDNYKAEVTVKEVIRGDQAWQMIKAKNEYSKPAPEGFEYLLARIKYNLIDIDNDKAVSLTQVDFDLISSDGKEYDHSYVSAPEPTIYATLYKGASHEGWVIFDVRKDDTTPKIAMERKYDGTGGLWFKAYK